MRTDTILDRFRQGLVESKPDDTIPAKLFAGSVTTIGVTVQVPKEIAERFLGGLTLQIGRSSIGEPTVEIIRLETSPYHPHAVTEDKDLFLPIRKMSVPWGKILRAIRTEDIPFFGKRHATKVFLKRDGGVLLTFGVL